MTDRPSVMARHSNGGKKSLGLRRLWKFSSCNVFLDRHILEESKAKFQVSTRHLGAECGEDSFRRSSIKQAAIGKPF